MSYKIQITVDETLNEMLRTRTKKMGLSVSSYARLALMSALPRSNNPLLDQALLDLQSDNTESLTLDEFNRQVINL